MFLVAANAARILTRGRAMRDAVGEEKEGTAGEESRGCDDEEGKFRAVLSGKGWFTHARRGEQRNGRGLWANAWHDDVSPSREL